MLKLFHQSRRVALCAAVVLYVFINLGGNAALSAQSAKAGWAQVPAILSRIKAPTFPNRDLKLPDYGAVADGKPDHTEEIRKAIAACNAAGGGRVGVTTRL